MIPGGVDSVGGILDAIDGEPAQSVGFGETGEARARERCAAVSLPLEQLLPLPDHPQVAVVYAGDLDVLDALLVDRRQLLVGDLESAISDDCPDRFVTVHHRR